MELDGDEPGEEVEDCNGEFVGLATAWVVGVPLPRDGAERTVGSPSRANNLTRSN